MRSSIRVSDTVSADDDRGLLSGQTVIAQRTTPPIVVFGRRLLHHRGGLTGGVILLLLALAAIFAARIAPYSAAQQNLRSTFQLPSAAHLLGTDNFGRDILSRIIYGARISLLIGLVSVAIAAFFGIVIGVLAGYYGGLIDTVLMRIIDVMLAFPGILLALIVVSVLGSSLTNLMIAVGVGSIPGFARLTRGLVLSIRGEAYVEAARVVGCRDLRIVSRYILPNLAASLIVFGTLGVASAILSGAALSFLGLGVQRPSPEWGVMLADGRGFLREYWWIATFPGLAIMLTTLSINMLGDGLRDILDPRQYRD
jgi:peptide/nickel transport system permease protein